MNLTQNLLTSWFGISAIPVVDLGYQLFLSLIWDISYFCAWFGISAISVLDLGYQLFLCLIWDISYFCGWFGISAISVVDLGYQLFLWLIWDISYFCGWTQNSLASDWLFVFCHRKLTSRDIEEVETDLKDCLTLHFLSVKVIPAETRII